MKILNVDDNYSNLYYLETLLRGFRHTVVSAQNGVQALAELAKADSSREPFDLVVTDILMPEMDGFQLCREIKTNDRYRRIPVIVYTATYTSRQDEEFALSLGAARFVVKPAEPEAFLGVLNETIAAEAARPSRSAQDSRSAIAPEDAFLKVYNQRLVQKLERKVEQLEAASKELRATVFERDREIERRILAEEGLKRSQEQLGLVWDKSTDGMLLTDASGSPLKANAALTRLCGPGGLFSLAASIPYKNPQTDSDSEFERTVSRPGGSEAILQGRTVPFDSSAGRLFFTLFRDITERRRREAERAALESQLAEARRMESVGRLAGGVAHDFNNLLTIINGYSGMLRRDLEPGSRTPSSQIVERLNQIHRAGERAADLTSQLLAFSRRRKIADRELNLNQVITENLLMLGRLVGDAVTVVTKLDPELGLVRGDSGQFLQVLMNLAANARDAMENDAMKGGGVLTIETANANPAGRPPQVAPGELVVLRVSDTGAGLDPAIIQDIFDPFFTTRSEGTGLGLFTVAGIVQRFGGAITVRTGESIPENPGGAPGTVFEILLPRVEMAGEDARAVRAVVEAAQTQPVANNRGAMETILVVDDRKDVRALVVERLRDFGYTLLEAGSGAEAIRVAAAHPGAIDLLLTDMLMANMSGRELAAQLGPARPDMKVLYMSGIVPAGVNLESTPNFIMKPFSDVDLLAKVREMLGGDSRTVAAFGAAD